MAHAPFPFHLPPLMTIRDTTLTLGTAALKAQAQIWTTS